MEKDFVLCLANLRFLLIVVGGIIIFLLLFFLSYLSTRPCFPRDAITTKILLSKEFYRAYKGKVKIL